MLGIRCPGRHALLRITSSKLRRPRRVLPSRASGFVLRRNRAVSVSIGEGPESTQLSRLRSPAAMTELGHEDQFLPPSPNGCCPLGQATFAGTHGNGRDAPIAAVRLTTNEPLGKQRITRVPSVGIFYIAGTVNLLCD